MGKGLDPGCQAASSPPGALCHPSHLASLERIQRGQDIGLSQAARSYNNSIQAVGGQILSLLFRTVPQLPERRHSVAPLGNNLNV